MRRAAIALSAVLLAVPLAATACGGGDTKAGALPTVSGDFGKKPAVKASGSPSGKLSVKVLKRGDGPAVGSKDLVVANYAGYTWSGSKLKLLGSTYKIGQAAAMPLGGSMFKGLNMGLTGQKVGSRVEIGIPPEDGYGKQGNPQYGVGKGDSLLFVVDVLKSYSGDIAPKGSKVKVSDSSLPTVTDQGTGKAPKITIPKADAPKKLVAQTLIKGTGPKVKKKQLVVVHYLGEVWRSKKVFDSSWVKAKGRVVGQPAGFTLTSGQGGVVKGWVDGLVGKRVGSRVLLVLPPAEGYGKNGNAQAGIKGTDTLVFVVDILGAR